MAASHHKRGDSHRSNRSNRYSESKSTNLGSYEPFGSEAWNFHPKHKPTVEIEAGDENTLLIYEKRLHPDFTRPYTAADVGAILNRMPRRALVGLRRVNLLGGTSKQEQVRFGPRFVFGSYSHDTIYLYAFPLRLMSRWVRRLPQPHILQEYTRVGARFQTCGSGWRITFDRDSLRRFYLCDVLVHEVGHHLDRLSLPKDVKTEERFAKFFVSQYIGSAVAALKGHERPG
ncbi:MAG: hypothetical protein U0835_19695 [Isosphaeraceae bacterium]